MEKIAIGVPYEISIEPSIDIGDFDAELVLERKNSRVGVELKKIKGKDIEYTFIVPSELKDLFKKASMDYSIFVYKENARFEVDSGKIAFIDEKDFKVKGGAGGKMRRAKDETPEPTATKKAKDDKKTPDPTPAASAAVKEYFSDPEAFAQSLIEREAGKAQKSSVDDFKIPDVAPKPTPLPEAHKPTERPATSPGNLHAILNSIETQKERDERRRRVNENIRKGLKKD